MTTTQVDLNSPQSRKLFSVVIKPTESPLNKSRLGKLQFPKRKVVETPHYLALTSRGAVPHLSQDMMRDHTSISGVYTALEDCESPSAELLSQQVEQPLIDVLLVEPVRYRESSLQCPTCVQYRNGLWWLSS